MNGTCHLCNRKNISISFHHLSYDPEFGLGLCRSCHILLHNVNKLYQEGKLEDFLSLCRQFGANWKGGTDKFRASVHREGYIKHYRKLYWLKHRAELSKKRKEKYWSSPEEREKRLSYNRAWVEKHNKQVAA